MLNQFVEASFKSLLIGETEKRRKMKEQVYSGCLFLVYIIDQSFAHVCIKFQLCASQSLRKERWNFLIFENLRERKMKKLRKIKGRINRRNLVLFPIKQQMIHNTCTKLQNPMCNSSWEIFVTNFPRCITLEWEMEKKEKEGRINLSFVFCHTIYLATLNVYTKFEDSGSHWS